MADKKAINVSVIVTFYNEEDVAALFHKELMRALDAINGSCEVIYIDDGSTDKTLYILQEFVNESTIPLTLIEFRRNFGQSAGIQAGFDYAAGEIIIAMDGDLQHDPAEIPAFLEKIEEGYDLVSGWRKKRMDNLWFRRLPSLIANKLMAVLSGIKLHDFGTTFKAYRRDVVKNINLYGDLHRFIPVIATQMGVRIYELPIKNCVREFGESKYGLSRTAKVFFDIMTVAFFMAYSTRPMHFWGKIGVCSFLGGGIMLLGIIVSYFVWQIDLRGTMQIAVMLIILGIQLFATGLILEFLSRIHCESAGKKIYAVREVYKNGTGLCA